MAGFQVTAENTALKDALLARMAAHGAASASSDGASSSSLLHSSSGLDLFLAEFGAVRLRVQVQEGDADTVLVSLGLPPFPSEIVTSAGLPMGAIEAVREEYEGFAEPLAAPEPGFNLTLRVDLAQLPPEPEARAALASRLARLRSIVMGAPLRELLRPLQGAGAGSAEGAAASSSALGIVTAVPYGDRAALLVLPQAQQVDVVWPVAVGQRGDAVLAAAFLQELASARSSLGPSSAPSLAFSPSLPPALAGVAPSLTRASAGFLSLRVRPEHVEGPRLAHAVWQLLSLQAVLARHLAACKAVLHTRMRRQTSALIEALRAPEAAEAVAGRLEQLSL